MKRREPPSQEAFNKLLLWLDPDPDTASSKYSKLHLRIARILGGKGCCDAEDLADQTFNVAAEKIDWLLENYQGDPSLYLYGIAKKLYQEWIKPQKEPPDAPPRPDSHELEVRSQCLDQCLVRLAAPEEKQLVLRYHEKDKPERIKARRQLADELGISSNALRIKVFHIHERLRPCIAECVTLIGQK